MDTNTKSRARSFGRVAAMGIGVAAPALGGALLSPSAGAATLASLPNPAEVTSAVTDAAQDVGIPLPEAPRLPSPVTIADNVLPMNLLRRDDNATDGSTVVETMPYAAQGPGPRSVTPQDVVGAANKTRQTQIDTVGKVANDLLSGDTSTVGQLVGVLNIPTQGQVANASASAQSFVDNVVSGQAMTDLQNTYDNFFTSDSYRAWSENTANAFAPREGEGVARAAAGISDYIDQFSRNPQQTLIQTIGEAGGPLRLITDPVGAVTQVVSKIAGPDFVADVFEWINKDLIGDGRNTFMEALPWLALPLATAGIGALLGGPLGALPGAGIGAVLGALAPHNLLGGLVGSVLGGLATGIPGGAVGLLASIAAFLPLMATLPLLGAAGGSALALAIAATVTYGTWLLTFIPVTIVAGVLGVIAALVVGAGLVALSGANPVMLLGAVSGGILAGLFVFTMVIGGYALLTFLIPTIVFAVLAPLLTLGMAGLGALAGLGIGTLLASVGIPLVTLLSAAISALPGAILGGLLGTGISSLISALVGSLIGGLIGAGIGSLIGAVLGGLAGIVPAIAIFLFVWLTKFADAAGDWGNGALGRIMEALRQGWENSALRHVFDDAQRFWNSTETGRNLNDLLAFLNSLGSAAFFLDGRRLRDLLLAGAAKGGIIGALLGAIPGGLLGALAGLLNPLNLLGGLLGAIAGAIPGALLGAAAGKGLSLLLGVLTTLVAAPLLFLPILAALAGLWALIAIPATLLAFAATLIGPLAIAVGATIIGSLLLSSPLWIPLVLIASVSTLIAFALSNPFLIVAFPPLAALVPFALAFGTVAVVAAALVVVVILGSLLLGSILIGIPAFLLSLPFFVFPALAVPLLSLLALPLLIPVAAGLSVLGAMALGALVDNLSSLLTVPLGAVLGGLIGATIGGVLGTAISALVRALVYGAAGAGIGAALGASAGAVIGAVLALLMSLRGSVRVEGRSIIADGRIVSNTPVTPRRAVPKTANATYGTGLTKSVDRSLVDVKDLVMA